MADDLTGAPYLDAEIPQLAEAPAFSPDLVQSFAEAAELRLAQAPGDLGLRLAALYPLRRAALSNLFQGRTHWSSGVTREAIDTFKHLAGLCAPDKLMNLIELKFELHNVYLAADWEKARELLPRLALLGLLEPAQMHAMRGQFWFLSVFGRQIEYEKSESDVMCDWAYSLPDSPSLIPELDHFTRPELLEKSSPAHWVLTAWCSNPKSPEPIPGPELAKLADNGLLVDPLDSDNGAQMSADRIRRYWHARYRDFVPVHFPALSEGLKWRLLLSVQDLREAAALDDALGALYCPLVARAEFALAHFNEAGSMYERALANRPVFQARNGDTEDYLWEFGFSTAWSYRQGGDYQRAIEMMGKLAVAKLPGAAWWMAKWYSECGKYDEAAGQLKVELESLLSPPDSWLLSSVLAIAAVAKDEEARAEKFIQRLRRDSPAIVHVLEGLLTEQWHRFERLQASSRDRWLHVVCETHAEPVVPQASSQYYRDAVLGYGSILENELRTRIFDPFRERVINDRDLRAKSAEEHGVSKHDTLLSFLHTKHSGLTLGQMIAALEGSLHPRNETGKALSRWVEKRFSNLQASIPSMNKVNFEWRRAKHESPAYERRDVVELSALSREALDWI